MHKEAGAMGILERFRMDGKRGFITGAGYGIGKALAEGFAEAGADFAVTGRSVDKLEEVARDLRARYGRRVFALQCDVSDAESVKTMVAACVKELGGLDFAVNNAGVVDFYPLEEAGLEEWMRVINVNLVGTMLCAQAAAKVMIAQGTGGAIVNMASISARIVNVPQRTSSYVTSKAAVLHLTRSMAVEWARYGIRVNSVSPGYISNPLNDDFPAAQQWREATPQKRMGRADELTGAFLYFASDASTYTTGSDLVVDGGYTLL